jgi:hypothetical protein
MHQKYMKHFGNDESLFKRGKNLLSYEMSLEMTKRLLLEERKRIQDNPEKPLCIIQLEGAYDWETTVEWNGQHKHLKFAGYIDRVDRLGDQYRVIDYKTGVVSESDLLFKTPKEDGLKIDAFSGCKFSLQLTLYCLFFRKRFGFLPADAQIISLINPGSPYSLKVEKSDSPIPDVTAIFGDFLEEFLTEIYDVNVPFAHAEKSMYCAYCVS